MTFRFPTFGVPDRIAGSAAWFVMVAGIPLAIFCLILLIIVAGWLGFDLLSLGALPMTVAVGLGAASAYYYRRWLTANHVPPAWGCAGLTGWVVGVSLLLLFAWPAALLLMGATVTLWWRGRGRLARGNA